MTIYLKICNRGFMVALNEFDPNWGGQTLVRVEIFWKSVLDPLLSWRVSRNDFEGGSFEFTTRKDGKRTGFRFQGPIQKISY